MSWSDILIHQQINSYSYNSIIRSSFVSSSLLFSVLILLYQKVHQNFYGKSFSCNSGSENHRWLETHVRSASVLISNSFPRLSNFFLKIIIILSIINLLNFSLSVVFISLTFAKLFSIGVSLS